MMSYTNLWLLAKLLFGWKNLKFKGNRNTFSQIHSSENWAVYNYEKCDRAREAKEIFDILCNMMPHRRIMQAWYTRVWIVTVVYLALLQVYNRLMKEWTVFSFCVMLMQYVAHWRSIFAKSMNSIEHFF